MSAYIFFRDDMWYPIALADDAQAVAAAECNPGTRRVEDINGNQVWPEAPKAVN